MIKQPSRREFLAAATAVGAAATLPKASALVLPNPSHPPSEGVIDEILRYVDPRVGTGGHGHCFPGASLPFGAVQLSPDTFNNGWDWCSGYHISDTSLMGFSHTHLSGTGCGDLLDFLVMAGTGSAKLVPGPRENPDVGYRSRFDHSSEVVTPGYYSVLLKDYNIKAELTATERVGLHRYTFPQSDQAYLILDLQHGYEGGPHPNVLGAELTHPAPDTLVGGRRTQAWGHNRHSYFSLQVSKAPTRIVFYQDDKEVPAPAPQLSGAANANLKAVLYFNTHANEVILVKTGISSVDPAGAARNAAKEIPDWNFDRIHLQARARWADQIGRIAVTGNNEAHKRTFYSALYHLSLGPCLFDDVDGRYRGMDAEVHTLPTAAQRNYTTFSCWDTYRAAHPTYTLINPERVPSFVNTLTRMAEQSPAGMAVWPLQGTETGTMSGYHSASIMCEAIQKGFKGIDIDRAYAAMIKRALVDDYRGLNLYRTMHYIPADKESESVSKTFEYCYNAWAIAHVAKQLGKSADADLLTQQSTYYRNYFDPSTGFMRPKYADGKWAGSSEGGPEGPFNPIDMGHSRQWRDYTESNAWQTTFATQHDPAGLIALFGGRQPFLAKLDELFTTAPTLPRDAPPDIAGMVGQYAHGNEPSHHIAYLYAYAGAPHKTQSRVRMLMETMYSPNPDGMQGNEDVGQMSAWFVLSALGFYAVSPVDAFYVLGSPLFDSATVNLGNGKKLEIEVKRSDPAHAYIQSFALNGKPQQQAWFRHADIANGGKLSFTMGAEPNLTFGTDPAVVPPSLTL